MQKVMEIDDEKRLQNLYERRMAQEIDGSILGEEFEGCIMRISGGNDKQGFPMRQGVLTNTRVRLLVKKGAQGLSTTSFWRTQAQVCPWMHCRTRHFRPQLGCHSSSRQAHSRPDR